MKVLCNEKGFTLIELIIVVAVLGVAISIANFGVGIVFQSNVESIAQQYQSDLRDVRSKTVSTVDNYELRWFYDTHEKKYSYQVFNTTKTSEVKMVHIRSNISIKIQEIKDDDTTVTVDLNAYAATDPILVLFFDASSGKVSGAGTNKQLNFIFETSASSDISTVELYTKLGRVYLNE